MPDTCPHCGHVSGDLSGELLGPRQGALVDALTHRIAHGNFPMSKWDYLAARDLAMLLFGVERADALRQLGRADA